MALTKIHCNFLEVVGPDWSSLDQDSIQCILDQIRSMELLGEEPELRGFVGTQQIDNITGGFFAIQYEHYPCTLRT